MSREVFVDAKDHEPGSLRVEIPVPRIADASDDGVDHLVPALGQHTDEVLEELSLPLVEIADLETSTFSSNSSIKELISMFDNLIVLHVTISAAIVIALILVAHLDPTISLILGSIYLGFTGGLGASGTVESITSGFGSTMADLGLLIGFGTLLGSLLVSTGELQRMVRSLLRLTGIRRFPYAFGTALGTVFPSVFSDVLYVLASPVVREAAKNGGDRALPRTATAMVAGAVVGLGLMVPGVACVAIAGIFDVPLGTMLLHGIVLAPLTVIVTTFVAAWLTGKMWRVERDLEPNDVIGLAEEKSDVDFVSTVAVGARTQFSQSIVLVAILLPVTLMIAGTVLQVTSLPTPPVMDLLSSPTVALLIGALVAYVFARRRLGRVEVGKVVNEAFSRAGSILLVTGAGGVYGSVIASTDIASALGSWFTGASTTSAVAIVLLAWTVAALAHLGIGSITVAAITAAGIVSPLISASEVAAVVVALAVGAGSLFAIHVSSNAFWLVRSLLGLSTSGALKIVTLTSSVASVAALAFVILLTLAY
ncbi:SLC13 family permease [Aeromicrobium sp. CF4.19]|uniref:GntP family permease n=1 Tax=Aeromicrobium sp. CF4.19 TaxID=3373082 RepID=UPI003EE760E3